IRVIRGCESQFPVAVILSTYYTDHTNLVPLVY
ncbi:MAG: hypothetical protein RLZZ536_1279, partial [Planctomycetota bacterium]